MKAPEDWSVDDLHASLQHALDLELWTIPLYLSALYSIKDLDRMEKKDYPVPAKLLASVAAQEMLHLELAGNLCVALGHVPEFERPHYDDQTRIPLIHPDPEELPEKLRGYTVRIGPLDRNQLKLFCSIEFPEVPRKTAWSDRDSYESIGELYEALRIGITHLWDRCFIGTDARYVQVAAFEGYSSKLNVDIGFSQQISDLSSALDAIDAIVAQGEGASDHFVPREFEPPRQTDAQQYHSGWFAPTLSHYQKLSTILANESPQQRRGANATGGIDGAFRQAADRFVRDVPSEQQRAAVELLAGNVANAGQDHRGLARRRRAVVFRLARRSALFHDAAPQRSVSLTVSARVCYICRNHKAAFPT